MYFAEFNDSFPPQTDGVAQTMRNYAYWLNRKYAPTCAVAPAFRGMHSHEEFPVIRFISMPLLLDRNYSLGLPEIAFRTSRRLDEMPLSLVHAHCPFASGTLALQTARKQGIPLVATFHTKFADDFAQRTGIPNAYQIAATYTAKFFTQADAAWAVNASSAGTLREYGYRGPVTIMPNGCDFTPRERTAENRAAMLRQFGLEDKPLLLFVGRVVEQKNISFLLESVARVRNGVDCQLLIVGDGDGLSGYRKQAAALGLKDTVHFAGAVRDRELLQNIYAAADLFTFPSVYDTDGLVKREAASCGCPSLLIDGSNAAEGILDGVNGFTAKLQIDDFAGQLLHTLGSPERLRQVGEESRRTVYASWEDVVGRAFIEYKNVIAAYNDRKARALGRRRRYSVPVAIAYDFYYKQTVRARFTTRVINREARHQTVVMKKAAVASIRRFRHLLPVINGRIRRG